MAAFAEGALRMTTIMKMRMKVHLYDRRVNKLMVTKMPMTMTTMTMTMTMAKHADDDGDDDDDDDDDNDDVTCRWR